MQDDPLIFFTDPLFVTAASARTLFAVKIAEYIGVIAHFEDQFYGVIAKFVDIHTEISKDITKGITSEIAVPGYAAPVLCGHGGKNGRRTPSSRVRNAPFLTSAYIFCQW